MRISQIIGSTAVLAAILLLIPLTGSAVENMDGTVGIGYIYTDHDGSRGVEQSSYNLYEGVALSLENFSYVWNNGLRAYGNFRNVTLDNRNIAFGLSKSGLGGVTFRHNKYRRIYGADEELATKRYVLSGDAWFQPIEYVRIYGGYGTTEKYGESLNLFDQPNVSNINPFDYSHKHWHIGTRLTYDRAFLEAEYRGSDLTDDVNELNDRNTKRYRVSAVTPVTLPRVGDILLNAGFQRYETAVENREDSLIANTAWGGARYYFGKGFNVRYSFIFDRARRTGDVSATDKITNAIYAGKTWRGVGGVEAGYRYRMNDDYFDELSTSAYTATAWYRPIPAVTLKAGFGTSGKEVNEGATLTGEKEFTRIYGQIRYRYEFGTARLKYENRQTDHDDIGTTADFNRLTADASAQYDYGTVSASYSYLDGEYENIDGAFAFTQHIVAGEIMSSTYYGVQLGFGGDYFRTKRDIDVESFTVTLKGVYHFMDTHALRVTYHAINFDDFDAFDFPSTYTDYYTGNILEVTLTKEL
jgi:hypothetical protein